MRNTAVDSVLSSVIVECPHEGCGLYVTYHKLADHQSVCPLAPCKCPVPVCGYEGPPPALYHHISTAHPMPVHRIQYGKVLQLQVPLSEPRLLLFTEEDGRVLVELYQLWEQVPVFSCQVTLTFDGGQLTQIQGRRMPGDPVSQGGTGAMTVTTALVRFLSAAAEGGYVCSEIREMTAGYSMTAVPTSSTFRLSPIWQIETDAGNFRLDADGTLTQITE